MIPIHLHFLVLFLAERYPFLPFPLRVCFSFYGVLAFYFLQFSFYLSSPRFLVDLFSSLVMSSLPVISRFFFFVGGKSIPHRSVGWFLFSFVGGNSNILLYSSLVLFVVKYSSWIRENPNGIFLFMFMLCLCSFSVMRSSFAFTIRSRTFLYMSNKILSDLIAWACLSPLIYHLPISSALSQILAHIQANHFSKKVCRQFLL